MRVQYSWAGCGYDLILENEFEKTIGIGATKAQGISFAVVDNKENNFGGGGNDGWSGK